MHLPAELLLLAERQHGVVTRRQAVQSGLSLAGITRRARAGVLEPMGTSCLRVPGHPATWRQLLMVGCLDLGPEALVSGRAAAALLRLDGFGEGPVEFLVPRTQRDRRTVGTVRSTPTIPRIDRTTVDEFACTSATRTIIELSSQVSRGELENAVDSALRLGTTSELFLRKRLLALRRPGRGGVCLLGEVLDGSGGHSYLERSFLELVKQAGLPRPACQTTYRTSSGRFIARTDFTFPPPARCIVEVAGHATHASRQQRARDAQRHSELQLHGFMVLTFTYEQVAHEPGWVIEAVRKALRLSSQSAEVSLGESSAD